MSTNTVYGFCRGKCQKWVRRDDMLSINVMVYDAANNESKVQIRLCPECHASFVKMIEPYRWRNRLFSEAEIIVDPEMCAQSDLEFDGSDAALEVARVVRERAQLDREKHRGLPGSKHRVCDGDEDSEAAMRRMGKPIDVTY